MIPSNKNPLDNEDENDYNEYMEATDQESEWEDLPTDDDEVED